MAITLTCPRCLHKQKIDEDSAKKDVPCKICHHDIKMTADKPNSKTKLSAAAGAKKTAAIQAGAPPGIGKKTKLAGKDDPSSDQPKSKKEKERAAARNRRAAKESPTMLYVLIGGGALLVFLFLCAGGGLGIYFWTGRSPAKENEQVAQNDAKNQNDIPPLNNNPIVFPQPKPIIFPQPNPIIFPQPNPIIFPNPNQFQQENLDPNDPKQIDRVVELLKGPEQNRNPALSWLERADPNHPRRSEVAKLLEPMVDGETVGPLPKMNAFFAAYFRWATKDNVPSLIRLVSNEKFTVWDNERRQKAMRKLGELKEGSAAEMIAKRLPNFFDRDTAQKALAEMGPVAQAAVLKYYNHKEGIARDSARILLQGYNTPQNLIMEQCLADLSSTEDGQRRAAVQWFAQAPVDEKRRSEVAKGLDKCVLNGQSFFANDDLVKALEKWVTVDNVPKLTIILNQENGFNQKNIMSILAKTRDPNAIKAIAQRINNFGGRRDAIEILRGCGSVAEQPVVEVMQTTTDKQARTECAKLLGEIGTKSIAGRALNDMWVRFNNPQLPVFQRDQQFLQAAQLAALAINQRGK